MAAWQKSTISHATANSNGYGQDCIIQSAPSSFGKRQGCAQELRVAEATLLRSGPPRGAWRASEKNTCAMVGSFSQGFPIVNLGLSKDVVPPKLVVSLLMLALLDG